MLALARTAGLHVWSLTFNRGDAAFVAQLLGGFDIGLSGCIVGQVEPPRASMPHVGPAGSGSDVHSHGT